MQKMKGIVLIASLLISLNSFTQNTYTLSGGTESPLLYSGLAGVGISIPLNKKIKPLTKEEILALDATQVNFFDRIAIKGYNSSAQSTSDMFLYSSSALPLTLLLDNKARNEFGTVSTMYLETVLVNYGITELTKVLFKRKRPYNYNKSLPLDLKQKRDSRKSFFSGHTSHVAASSFFTAKVLSDMNPEGSNTLYWATAATIPAITGYLRVKGGKHFPTDVIFGYVVGAIVGIVVPELHKQSL